MSHCEINRLPRLFTYRHNESAIGVHFQTNVEESEQRSLPAFTLRKQRFIDFSFNCLCQKSGKSISLLCRTIDCDSKILRTSSMSRVCGGDI